MGCLLLITGPAINGARLLAERVREKVISYFAEVNILLDDGVFRALAVSLSNFSRSLPHQQEIKIIGHNRRITRIGLDAEAC